jgi:Protein of unknown function, DUF547
MRFFLSITFLFATMNSNSQFDFIELSQDVLSAVQTAGTVDSFRQQLAGAKEMDLWKQLDTETKKLAFWLNIYNAYTQIGLKENPEAYKKRNQFFTNKFIIITGQPLSLDLVEHGILRHSKWKYSLGHFNKMFKSSFEKKFRLMKVDWRIHFALNCGAKSCPPIAFYKPEELDKQLSLATKIYLKSEVSYHANENAVAVPAIFSWFRGDFGGKKGIRQILKQQHLIPEASNPKLKWLKYNWSLALQNFTTE